MNDFNQVLEMRIELMKEQLKDNNLTVCSSIANDLTKLAFMFDAKDYMFIFGSIESVFKQLTVTFARFDMDTYDKSDILTQVKEFINKIFLLYQEDSKLSLYETLRDMSVTVAKFHFSCSEKFNVKTDVGTVPVKSKK